ncbi:MAG: SOS response-associated peptidase family protein [Saprospiraceae bacterium]|nr:SOS response-associated peptidase family protein [Saprospiraceae bacterium]
MCGRSSLTKTEKEIEKRFHATFYSEELERYNPLPNYNVAPGSFHPVITNQDPEYIHLYKWGLIPFWAKDKKIAYSMINARAETLMENRHLKMHLNITDVLFRLMAFMNGKILTDKKFHTEFSPLIRQFFLQPDYGINGFLRKGKSFLPLR